MSQNTWGLRFTKIDADKDEFKPLLALNTGDESETRALFEQIKEVYSENAGEPDCIIDLLDENESIIDDYPISQEQMVKLIEELGHPLSL